MAKLLVILSLSLGLFAAMPAAPADADFGALPQLSVGVDFDSTASLVGWGDFWSWLSGAIQSIKEKMFGASPDGGGIHPGSSGASVPELDMTVAGSAIVLILGGVAFLASRRREQE